MNAQQLKNSILQRAIEGKLVEQREEEGTAAELLREIKAEKARLVKEGKLKKEKPLRSITAEEIPFEIPESWEWVRLNDLSEAADNAFADGPFGSNLKKEHYTSNQEVRIIQLSNIGDFAWRNENLKYTTFSHAKTISRSLVKAGNIVIAKMMPAGRAIEVPTIEKSYILSSDAIKFAPHQTLYKPYLLYAINSPTFKAQINSEVHGVTRIRTSLTKIKNYLIPLPPLAEQKRIVAKIEELLPHVEQYGKAHDELTALNEKFPDAMKKSILQYAMEGKLVEQREEEGTAKELFAAIKAEKAKLVKEGKLKKEKPLPEIKAEEIPFEIPESWEWVRLGEICFPFRYGTSEKSSKTGSVPVLRMGNIQHGSIDYSDLVYSNNEEEIKKYQLDCNDLLFNRTNSREWVGKTALYRGEQPAIFAGYLIQVKPIRVDSEYLNYVMNSEYERNYCKRVKSDGINQSNVNAQKLSKFIIPLPPLAEQKRIVAKIEELLACCGALEK